MRVTAVRTVLVTAPWTGDPFWLPGESFERSAALVVVDTDEGISGVGETIMGYFCSEVVSPLIDYYGGLLRGLGLDPRQPEAAFREPYQRSLWWGRVGVRASVLSGLEMALWDIAGKALAEARHVGLIVHTGRAIGSGFMANLHVAFASPNARFVEYVLAPDNVRAELLTEPVRLADGFIERPTAPGLGITLDDAFAARYPYRAGVVGYA